MVEEAELVERRLEGVRPRDLSFDVLESSGVGGGCFLPSMRLPMQLYYVPSFMALFIADCQRAGFVETEILGWFRDGDVGFALSEFQDAEGIIGWVLAHRPVIRGRVSRAEMLERAARLRTWYFEGFRPVDNPYVRVLTEIEQRAFLRFFGVVENVCSREPKRAEGIMGRAAFAAQAMLRGDSLSERLGARTDDDRMRLIEIIDVFARRFPALFPMSEVHAIREALEREVMGG